MPQEEGASQAELALVANFGQELLDQVGRTMVGVADATLLTATAALARGHVLLEDVPGVGKTRFAQVVSRLLGARFRRIQFTPDVLPSDVTGSSVFRPEVGEFQFRPGPLFAHVILADEINRATPRTQAALLEAMEERQITVDGTTHALPEPFLVLATQNPVELEGTFPLPEAQLDRFLLRLTLGYPDEEAERDLLMRFARREGAEDLLPSLQPLTSPERVLAMAAACRTVDVHPDVQAYLLAIVRGSRSLPDVRLGGSPRAALALFRAVQAWAALHGRNYAVPEDVARLAVPVLAHRLLLATEAELQGTTAVQVVERLLAQVPVPTEAV